MLWIKLTWDKSINPNIDKYKSYDIFKQTKGYPKYKIIIYSDNDRKEFDNIDNNFYTIKNLYVDTDYKLKLIVKHRGILQYSNGFK